MKIIHNCRLKISLLILLLNQYMSKKRVLMLSLYKFPALIKSFVLQQFSIYLKYQASMRNNMGLAFTTLPMIRSNMRNNLLSSYLAFTTLPMIRSNMRNNMGLAFTTLPMIRSNTLMYPIQKKELFHTYQKLRKFSSDERNLYLFSSDERKIDLFSIFKNRIRNSPDQDLYDIPNKDIEYIIQSFENKTYMFEHLFLVFESISDSIYTYLYIYNKKFIDKSMNYTGRKKELLEKLLSFNALYKVYILNVHESYLTLDMNILERLSKSVFQDPESYEFISYIFELLIELRDGKHEDPNKKGIPAIGFLTRTLVDLYLLILDREFTKAYPNIPYYRYLTECYFLIPLGTKDVLEFTLDEYYKDNDICGVLELFCSQLFLDGYLLILTPGSKEEVLTLVDKYISLSSSGNILVRNKEL